MGWRRKSKSGNAIGAIIALGVVAYFWQPLLFLAAIGVVIWIIYLIVVNVQAGMREPLTQPAVPPPPRRVHTSIAPPNPPPLVNSYMHAAPQPSPEPVTLPPMPEPPAPLSRTHTIRCARCKTWLPLAARFCRRCGMPQPIANQSIEPSPAGRVAV